MDIRKLVYTVEEVQAEAGVRLARPIRRAGAIAVIANPYAGKTVEDLSPLFEVGLELGELATKRLVDLLGGPAVSYGKAAIVGTAGEMEHGGAILHPKLGKPMRAAIGGGEAIIPSNVKVAAPGATIDGPAIIAEANATTVVEPEWRAVVTPLNHLLLERSRERTTALAVGTGRPVLALWWDADRSGYTLASGFHRGVGYVWLAVAGVGLVALIVAVAVARRLDDAGRPSYRLRWIGTGALIVLPVMAWTALGGPVEFEVPVLEQHRHCGERYVPEEGLWRIRRGHRVAAQPPLCQSHGEPARVQHPHQRLHAAHHLPPHLEVAGEAPVVGRVEHQVGLPVQPGQSFPCQGGEDPPALVVRVRGGVHGPDRPEDPGPGPQSPSEERSEAHDAPLQLAQEHQGRPEGVVQVLPPEERRRSLAGRTERIAQEPQDLGLVRRLERPDPEVEGGGAHDSSPP